MRASQKRIQEIIDNAKADGKKEYKKRLRADQELKRKKIYIGTKSSFEFDCESFHCFPEHVERYAECKGFCMYAEITNINSI